MISVCIITRNESENLKECLVRLSKYAVEIVLVDTGSEDDSVSVAKEYTDNVYYFPWCDDFSAARNFAVQKAHCDMIMMLDSDEFIERWDMDEFERLINSHKGQVGRIHLCNEYMADSMGMLNNELVSRVFDRRYFMYEGIIHEQIVSRDGELYETYPVPIYINHSGYSGGAKERQEKAERNLRLLFQALSENEEDPYLLFQIGKSYYYKGDYQRAVDYFDKAMKRPLDVRLEYVIDLVTSYGYACINAGEPEQALLLENVYEDFSSSADFVFMLGHVYMQNARFEQAVNMFLHATEFALSSVEGVTSYLAYYNVGVIYECLGLAEEAKKYYEKCGDYELAKDGYKRVQST